MLKHFNTDKRIEGLLEICRNVTIVKQMDADAVLQACLPDTLFR